jgi:dienelactone hydrolase
MLRPLPKNLACLVFAALLLLSVPAGALGLDPAFSQPVIGPTQAKGVVVWSHGRSINAEDSQSPTPAYLRALRDGGWDVLRFNRARSDDTLTSSTAQLVDHVSGLKRKGYQQVVLAGQSFGAFLALMAADESAEVDAVVATAPAAYGSFGDFYDSWRLNATKLYPLLEQVKSARVMVFYFHDDDFDPGGRGDRSREILSARGRGYAVVDQPAFLTGHWASSSGLFLRRYGSCIRDFAENKNLTGEQTCSPRWGTSPSGEMKLPPELADVHPEREAAAAPTGSGAAADSAKAPYGFGDVWYGFYPNGREILLGVEAVHGNDLTAVYAIGPSIDGAIPAAWSRRQGHIVDDSFVFEEKGKSALRFRPRPDGGLGARWSSTDGKTSMTAHLRPIDPQSLKSRETRRSAPVASTAAHSDGDQTEN